MAKKQKYYAGDTSRQWWWSKGVMYTEVVDENRGMITLEATVGVYYGPGGDDREDKATALAKVEAGEPGYTWEYRRCYDYHRSRYYVFHAVDYESYTDPSGLGSNRFQRGNPSFYN